MKSYPSSKRRLGDDCGHGNWQRKTVQMGEQSFRGQPITRGMTRVFTGECDRVRRIYDHFKGWRGKWHQATNWKSGEGELDLLWHWLIRLILDYVAKQIQFWTACQILDSSWPYRIFVWTYGDFFGMHDWLVVVWNMTFIFLHIFRLGISWSQLPTEMFQFRGVGIPPAWWTSVLTRLREEGRLRRKNSSRSLAECNFQGEFPKASTSGHVECGNPSFLEVSWNGDTPKGWFIMENTMKIDDLGYPISGNAHLVPSFCQTRLLQSKLKTMFLCCAVHSMGLRGILENKWRILPCWITRGYI